MASHELTLRNYHNQLKDKVKSIYDNYTFILRTKNEHLNFEVSVKSAEIVRSYEFLMQLVAEIRTFLIINDLLNLDSPDNKAGNSEQPNTFMPGTSTSQHQTSSETNEEADEKLIKLRDEMAMFLYELEMPLP